MRYLPIRAQYSDHMTYPLQMTGNISRESSKESSEESDETGGRSSGLNRSHGHRNRLVKQHSRQSEMSASSGISAMSSVSDYSQDKR